MVPNNLIKALQANLDRINLDLDKFEIHLRSQNEEQWDKVRKGWRYTLPVMETAALFKILNRNQISRYEKGGKYRYD